MGSQSWMRIKAKRLRLVTSHMEISRWLALIVFLA